MRYFGASLAASHEEAELEPQLAKTGVPVGKFFLGEPTHFSIKCILDFLFHTCLL